MNSQDVSDEEAKEEHKKTDQKSKLNLDSFKAMSAKIKRQTTRTGKGVDAYRTIKAVFKLMIQILSSLDEVAQDRKKERETALEDFTTA